ncbi:hypothetical protein ASD07_11360 [Duganella sp. Root336D2]|nr:hypothetical protein ASD07_11360 [Duganella sp. Root336D2]
MKVETVQLLQWKSISELMSYLKRCSIDASPEEDTASRVQAPCYHLPSINTGLDIVLLLNQLFQGHAQHPISISVRLTLTLVLLSYFYRGFTWARVVTGLLLLVTTIDCAVAAASRQSWVLWPLLATYAFALYVVFLSPSVRRFLTAQKAKRTYIPQEAPAHINNERNLHQH